MTAQPISANTTKWTPQVSAELIRQGIPLPAELILAVIDVESRGVSGLVNPKSGASGLMQVMPITLRSYNNVHPLKFTIQDLRSKDNPVSQIRVGIWALGQYWRAAHAYLSQRLSSISMDELAKISDLMFAAGGESVRQKLNRLAVPSVAGLKETFPKWNALPHIQNVFDRVSPESISQVALNSWISTSAKSSVRYAGASDWIVKALIGIAVGYFVSFLIKEIGGINVE